MARRYSYDLRMKIFKAVDDGLSIVKACKIFNISRNTIYRWKHLKCETGDIKAKPYGSAKGYNAKIDLKRQFRIRESMKGIIQKVYKRYYVISLNIVSINNSLFIAHMSVNAILG
ncbi:IS630 family transposase [Orientia tsutsugamushi str. Gilliam]|uniref:IS630 family transposase n=1 Tax=Orientia tsutsugamushi str. Gilliam TaxID=1359184 RepID=A0A2U3QW62_ORITS|nr:IS630 family transposase [Orientia tsutsugamushi str. Gilliam]